jgi:hypothetical protein
VNRERKPFRMGKSDHPATPTYHRIRDSIEAHLTIVFAALAVSRWIEHQTGWSIRRFVRTGQQVGVPHLVYEALNTSSRCHSRNSDPGRSTRRSGRPMT